MTAPQPAESTRTLLLKIDGLTAEVGGLKREQESFRAQLLGGVHEREQLRYLLDQAERRTNRAENNLKVARARLPGDNPIRKRDDGAMAWRASLLVKTPSARRIHYWVLKNGQIELAQVATHDDFA